MNLGDCVHFNGTASETCKAGVNYRQLAGEPFTGWVLRLPCMSWHVGSHVARCDKYQPATQEDVDKDMAEVLAMFKKADAMMELMDRLKGEHPRGSRGTEKCPRCGQKLHWRISAYNGHCHVSCENPECVSVME